MGPEGPELGGGGGGVAYPNRGDGPPVGSPCLDKPMFGHRLTMVVTLQNHSSISIVLHISHCGAATHKLHNVQQGAVDAVTNCSQLGLKSSPCLSATSGLLLIHLLPFRRRESLTSVLQSVSHTCCESSIPCALSLAPVTHIFESLCCTHAFRRRTGVRFRYPPPPRIIPLGQ